MWANIGMTDNFDITFNAYFCSCDGSQYLWVFNNEYFVLNNASTVPHDDIPPQNIYTVVDAHVDEFFMETLDFNSILTSTNPRKIVVSLAANPVSYETFYKQEVVLLNPDCSASSQHHGYGTWSWANGGFTVGFNDIGFSFPRMDGPPDNTGACRM